MDFSEKLTALLSLTSTKNAELADAIGVGRPYVSRMKTGERKMPSNSQIIQKMAMFFAKHCEDDYKRSALFEFTSDPRLHTYVNETVLTDIIFGWLTGSIRPTLCPAGHFLKSFEQFSPDDVSEEGADYTSSIPQKGGITVYRGNAGKRQAFMDFIAYMFKLDAPVTVKLFSDESYEWLTEDSAFSREIKSMIVRNSEKPFIYERIQQPFLSTELAFNSMEQWMTGYMTGTLRQYSYPGLRDELHRRTIMVIPDHIAMYSNSLFGDHEALFATLTREPEIVSTCDREFKKILDRCKATVATFKTESFERLFSVVENMAFIDDYGAFKTNGLSFNTMPASIIKRFCRSNSPFERRLFKAFDKCRCSRGQIMYNNNFLDIMCMPSLDNVLAGKEPIPGSSINSDECMYYTIDEYIEHLENILWHLKEFPKYQAVFLDEAILSDSIVYIKGESHALLVKQSPPNTVCEITDKVLTSALYSYLRHISHGKREPEDRSKAIELVKGELEKIHSII